MNLDYRSYAIRTKLSIAYGLSLVLLLILVGLGIYFFLRIDLIAKIDAKLAVDMDKAAARYSSQGVLPAYPDATPRVENHWWEVWRDGQMVQVEKSIVRRQNLPSFESTCGPESQRSMLLFEGQEAANYRIACRMLNDTVTIRAFRTTKDVDHFLDRLVLISIFALAAVTLLCSLAGLFLAGWVLRPIARMTRDAEKIYASDELGALRISNPSDELGRLGLVLNRQFESIHAAMTGLRQFTADASHELRTPLAALRSAAEVSLTKYPENSPHRPTLEAMLDDINRISGLINQLLVLSRADAGQVQSNPERCDLNLLSKQSIEHLQVLADQKGQSLSFLPSDQGAWVMVDPLFVGQAITNVIDNAIKYSPAHSEIRVGIARDRGLVHLVVEDSAKPIPPEFVEKVFDRFFRIDDDRSRDTGGTGLGLSIALWAVESSGGTIGVEGAQRGNRIRIRFPDLT